MTSDHTAAEWAQLERELHRAIRRHRAASRPVNTIFRTAPSPSLLEWIARAEDVLAACQARSVDLHQAQAEWSELSQIQFSRFPLTRYAWSTACAKINARSRA